MCYNFGATSQIPADFFAPGSDPFDGQVCLRGVPLGHPDFPDADTLIQRSDDPFLRCDLPSETEVTVDIQVIAMSLESTAPIIVTYDGGQNPEDWDVTVDLSVNPQPMGSLTAKKTNCNGGTYTNVLPVLPRFTFIKVGRAWIRLISLHRVNWTGSPT